MTVPADTSRWHSFLCEAGVLAVNQTLGQMLAATRGINHSWCSRQRLETGDVTVDDSTLVAGSVQFVHAALAQLGRPVPVPLGFDEVLAPWLYRTVERTTAADAVERAGSMKLFVKPAAQLKVFTGGLSNTSEVIDALRRLDPATEVFVSDPVTLLAEWRCYVTNGRVVDVAQYVPDFDVCRWPEPDPDLVQTIASASFATHGRAGFSVDVGLLDTGEVAVVELNDGYALGCYGTPLRVYGELIEARWAQLLTA